MSRAWSPSRLPKIRDQIARTVGPNGLIQSTKTLDADDIDGLNNLARQLLAADLWWVAPPMTALAVSSADTIPEVRWTPADRPQPIGLVVWDGGIGAVDRGGVEYPIDAALWGPAPGGQMWIWSMVRRQRLEGILADAGQGFGEGVPALIPLGTSRLDVLPDWRAPQDIADDDRFIATVLAATWRLALQPTLAEHAKVDVDRPIRRSYGRAGRGDPDVTLIDLRRRYVPSDREEVSTEPGRRYRHRWVVSGHWRNQPCGKDRADRKQIWITEHVKGPDGAPLLATTRVNVWRR